MDLPVIPWVEGFKFEEPPGYEPQFADLGLGQTVDEARLPWILDALLAKHPDAERIRQITTDRPGLNLAFKEGSTLIMVRLAATGEPIGLFDRRHLDV